MVLKLSVHIKPAILDLTMRILIAEGYWGLDWLSIQIKLTGEKIGHKWTLSKFR
jgi:hypothetical protein